MNEDLKWLAENEHEWKEGALAVRRGELNRAEWFFDSEHPYSDSTTRPAWQAARDELSGKPGWDKAPEWARILVQSSIGNWFFGDYKDAKPRGESEWVAVGGSRWSNPFRGRVLGDWRNTLERRPEPVEETAEEEVEEYGPLALYDAVAQYRKDHPEQTISPLRQFTLSQIHVVAEHFIYDIVVRDVFMELVTEMDDGALAGVAARVVK